MFGFQGPSRMKNHIHPPYPIISGIPCHPLDRSDLGQETNQHQPLGWALLPDRPPEKQHLPAVGDG